jgi:hypothetical protein
MSVGSTDSNWEKEADLHIISVSWSLETLLSLQSIKTFLELVILAGILAR